MFRESLMHVLSRSHVEAGTTAGTEHKCIHGPVRVVSLGLVSFPTGQHEFEVVNVNTGGSSHGASQRGVVARVSRNGVTESSCAIYGRQLT